MIYAKNFKEIHIASIKRLQCQIEAFEKADEISITPAYWDKDWEPTRTGDPLWLRDVGSSWPFDGTSFARAVCDIIIARLRRLLEWDERELAAMILHEEKESALDEEYGEPTPPWATQTLLPEWMTAPAGTS